MDVLLLLRQCVCHNRRADGRTDGIRVGQMAMAYDNNNIDSGQIE
jgi:hypothetical protein